MVNTIAHRVFNKVQTMCTLTVFPNDIGNATGLIQNVIGYLQMNEIPHENNSFWLKLTTINVVLC